LMLNTCSPSLWMGEVDFCEREGEQGRESDFSAALLSKG
jgi:hypothetical protein